MAIKNFVEELLTTAYEQSASDIFIIPFKEQVQISLKVRDGKKDYKLIDSNLGNQLINFLKFQSGMDISEHRRPQIGSTEYQICDEEVNLRLSSVGNYLGKEILVIRLIYSNINNISISKNFRSLLNRKGLILFSGPMGSGKTSFMYQYAKELSKSKMVMCIEDPTEIKADNFIQLQVNEDAGMSYEELIKSSLRQRPDILLIGEIRDAATAKLAVKAALSGYTVLSTIHAKSKFSVVDRMLEFNVDLYSLKSSLVAAIYQRLIPNKNDKLICVQDLLIDSQLDKSFDRENYEEFNDWQDKITDLYKEGVIHRQIFEEFICG